MIVSIFWRILAAIPIMAVVGVFVFSLLYMTPGDPAAVLAGASATPAEVEALRVSLGLDQSYIVRLLNWAGGVVRGDLGVSLITRQPVATTIAERLVPTFSLMALTVAITALIGIPLGVAASAKPGKLVDRFVMGASVLGFSVPVFVTGYVLAYIFGLQLKWLPVQGYEDISEGFWVFLRHFILPACALAVPYTSAVARMTRTSMLEVISQDFVRTARAKGVSRNVELYRHALGNAAIPIVTVLGIGVGSMLGGAVILESVFALPGIGRLTMEAIARRDYPLIQGVVLFFSLVYVLINLVVDISYTFLDPRTR